MKIKFTKLDMLKSKIPKASSSQDKLTSLFKDIKGFNKDGLIKEAQNRIPEPIKKFIPNMKGSTGKDIDISKITEGSAFDVDGMLSKNANVDDIMKTFNSGMTLDIDPSSAGVPSDAIKEFTKLM